MDIYILRHGEAQPRSEDLPEAERELTQKGRRDVERIARLAWAAKVQPDLVLSSPYARAKQTAEIAIQAFESKPDLVETPVLVPSGSPKQVWREIKSHSKSRQLLLVGHEPQLSDLVAYLLVSPALRLDLKKGALVRIRVDQLGVEPHGELKWVLTPGLVRPVRKFTK
jgi:phosphohistidine phosphatase